MKYIQIKKYKTYDYKGYTIGIWKTANKSFIIDSYYSCHLTNSKYLSEEGKKIAANLKYIYFWDVLSPEGYSFNGFLDDLPPVFCVVDSYRPTEEESLSLAKKAIDCQINKIEFEKIIEKLKIKLPTHFYDPLSQKVISMASGLDKRYDPETSQVIFNYFGREISISV